MATLRSRWIAARSRRATLAVVVLLLGSCSRAHNGHRANSDTSSSGGKGAAGSRAGSISTAGAGKAGSPFVTDAGVVPTRDAGPRDPDDPAHTDPDPHFELRKSIVDDYCGLPTKYPCLKHDDGALLGIDAAECSSALNASTFAASGHCWDEWVAVMECLVAESYQCPCSGDACLIPSFKSNTTTRCIAESRVYQECSFTAVVEDLERRGEVTGARASCSWNWTTPNGGCFAACTTPPPREGEDRNFTVRCDGSPQGPFQCPCMLNDRQLIDDSSPGDSIVYAEDCAAVAQAMADGACLAITDCCLSWTGSTWPDRPPVARCSCTADDMPFGYESCEAAAISVEDGQVVELCPQYVSPNVGGPIPRPGEQPPPPGAPPATP